MKNQIANPLAFPLSEEQVLPYNAIMNGISASVDAGPGSGKSHTARATVKNVNMQVDSIPFGRALADEEINVYGGFSHITSLNFHRRGIKLCGNVVVDDRKLKLLAETLELPESDDGDDDAIKPEAVAGLTACFKKEAVGTWEDALPLDEIATKYKFSAKLIPFAVKLLAMSDAQKGTVDFADMLRFPVLAGKTSWCPGMVVLDEVQDYTPDAFVFLTKCLAKPSTLALLIGDVDQSLMQFAGARPALFNVLSDYFNCAKFQITENRRCSKAVVANAPRMSKTIKALPDAPQGQVGTKSQSEVFDAILAGEYRDDAVISEANAPLVTFGLSLLIKGVPVQMRTDRLEKLIYRYCPFTLLDTRKVKIGDIAEGMRKIASQKDGEGIDTAEANDVANAVASLEAYCLAKQIVKPQFLRVRGKLIPKHPIFQALEKLCNGKTGVTLLTGHTAKGLEWNTVFHLPGKVCAPEQDWEVHQAQCLDYVIKTRARLNHFTLITPETEDAEAN